MSNTSSILSNQNVKKNFFLRDFNKSARGEVITPGAYNLYGYK